MGLVTQEGVCGVLGVRVMSPGHTRRVWSGHPELVWHTVSLEDGHVPENSECSKLPCEREGHESQLVEAASRCALASGRTREQE
jgi:hypothetical protein